MTKMVPSVVNPQTQSAAEKRLFDLIRRSLNNDWVALHSLALMPETRGRPWTEVDFVLIGPPGVFCLEVKGGRVAKVDGMWHFTDRNGNVNQKYRGPFEQASDASHELRGYLKRKLSKRVEPLTGSGVMTPDIKFSPLPPEAVRETVYDETDARYENSFDRFVGRMAGYWTNKFPISPELSPDAICEIVNLLRGDFELRPSLSLAINQVKEEIIQLTNQQKLALSGMRENRRVVVRGSAGTGKTLCAIDEALRLASANNNVLLCCFNRRLAHSINRAISKTENIYVINIHGLMVDLVRRAGLMNNLPRGGPDDNPQLFNEDYPALSLEAIDVLGMKENYDALVIDEGQDLLTENYITVLTYLLKGGINGGTWRIFLDPKQNIFRGFDPSVLEQLEVQGAAAKYLLNINCRNTRHIAYQTGILADISIDPMPAAEGPDVDFELYEDDKDACRKISRLVNRLLSDGIDPSQIVILSNRRKSSSTMSQGFIDVPYLLIEPGPDEVPNTGGIGYYTVHTFKGLESDIVILIDLEDIQSDFAPSNNYVGASRAKSKLAISLHNSAQEDYRQLATRFGERLKIMDSSVVEI